MSGSVRVITLAGTATAGEDYLPLEQRLAFPPASPNAPKQDRVVQLTTSQDGVDEPDETFQVVLDQPLDNVSVGEPRTMTVTIVDDDPPVEVRPELTTLRLAPKRFRGHSAAADRAPRSAGPHAAAG
jgi:Calx-beta domain